MRIRKGICIGVTCVAALVSVTALAGTAVGAQYNGGFLLGYSGGPGGQINGMVSEFSRGFPMAMRFAIGYTSVEPGDAFGARRVFINDATNGTPSQKGWFWDFRFDFVYRFKTATFSNFAFFLGPRYLKYTANFLFVGGNEDFLVNTNQWGLGLGLDGNFAIGQKADLVLTGGLDYYQDAKLSGHDTSYSPSGGDVNSRKGYSYAEADEVINQPKLEPRLMIGVSYRFGH